MTTSFSKIIESHRLSLEAAIKTDDAVVTGKLKSIIRAEFKALQQSIEGALVDLTDRLKQMAIDLWLSGGSLRLIWLDDEVDRFKETIEELGEYGIEILPAKNIQAAMAQVTGEVDGVILDLVLDGGEDGFQFLRNLRTEHIRLPVVLCSKYGLRAAVQRRGIELGALGSIKKHEAENPQLAIILHEFFTAEKQVARVRDLVLSGGDELEGIVNQWSRRRNKAPNGARSAIDLEVAQLSTEISRKRKSPSRILAILKSIKSILEHAAGDVVGEELLGTISDVLN